MAGRQVSIEDLNVQPDERKYFQDVKVTQDEKLQGNSSVTWTEGKRGWKAELLAVISNRTANKKRLREYGWRMHIEDSFRDDKSGGFDIEHTRLQHTERLERLLLAVAIAALWCHELGEQILQDQNLRNELDPGGKDRQLSIFQLGLRFLKRCIAVCMQRLPFFRARLSNLKLDFVLPCPPSTTFCQ